MIKDSRGFMPSFPSADTPAALDRYREKWREAPRGSDTDGRVFSSDLLALPDEAFLAAWDAMAARRYAGELGWLGTIYGDSFRGRRVLELGSGLGFDGIRFAELGTAWTFADIVPDNLAVIRRVADLKRLTRLAFHLIGDDLSFDALPADLDAIWVFGSLHHVPFEIARREALAALQHLKPTGRWMELVYPRERWLREGARPFDEWGRITDGERTPWVEWYDIEKVRRRLFPAPLRTLLDFDLCSSTYRWLDLQYVGGRPFRLADFDLAALSRSRSLLAEAVALHNGASRRPAGGHDWSFVCPARLFDWAAIVDLSEPLRALGPADGWAVDLEIAVSHGTIGVGLTDAAGAYIPAAEAVIDTGRDTRVVTLRAVGTGAPSRLVFRNLHAELAGQFAVHSAILRVAN
jgi:SAM-dependent methyltransferase